MARRSSSRDSLDSIIEKLSNSPSAQPPKYVLPPPRYSVMSKSGLTRNKSTSSIPSTSSISSSTHESTSASASASKRVARAPRVQRTYGPPSTKVLVDSEEEVVDGIGKRERRRSNGKGKERERDRSQVREEDGDEERVTEWSENMWLWEREPFASGSAGGGGGGNKNLIKDVPAAVRRKIGKRESSQLLSGAELMAGNGTGSVSGGERMLREKTSKSNMYGPGANFLGPSQSGCTGTRGEGVWTPVVVTVRENGTMLIYSEANILKYRLHLTTYSRTDIRQVDVSLFQKPHVVSLHRAGLSSRPSTSSNHPTTQEVLSTYAASTTSAPPMSSSLSTQDRDPISLSFLPDAEESLFFLLPNRQAYERAFAIFSAHSKPEIYPYLPHREGMFVYDPPTKWEGLKTKLSRDTKQQCRMWRSVELSINEGRSLGLKYSTNDSNTVLEGILGSSRLYFARPTSPASPSSVSVSLKEDGLSFIPQSTKRKEEKESDGLFQSQPSFFTQILVDGEVAARTLPAKGSGAAWNAHFVFSNLGPYSKPIIVEVYQQRGGKTTHLGNVALDLSIFPNGQKTEEWYGIVGGGGRELIGELNLGVKTVEQPVLVKGEYGELADLLLEDEELQVAREVASEILEVGQYAGIMLRIFDASDQAVQRIVQMARVEISTFSANPTTLFRGNTLFTKLVEAFMRWRGMDYVDKAVGGVVRKICAEKVVLEIDPSKCKNEKEVKENVKELKKWSEACWRSIYDSRSACPAYVALPSSGSGEYTEAEDRELRSVFYHIQQLVRDHFKKDQDAMRFTSISAFVFLRFFVPAILYPKLWGVVPRQPGEGCRRTLTLIGKTLQGLANMSTSFQEPGMKNMSDFLAENQSAFIDFIAGISTETDSGTKTRQDWKAARQFRSDLSGLAKDSVPTVPHLNDLSKDFALLASCVIRNVPRQSPTSGARERSLKSSQFIKTCFEVHDRAAAMAISYNLLQPITVVLPRRSPHRTSGSPQSQRPRIATDVSSSGSNFAYRMGMSPDTDTVTPPGSPKALTYLIPSSLGTSPSSTSISKRTRRSYTVTNLQPSHSSPPRRSISSERLAILASDRNPSKVARDAQVQGPAYPEAFHEVLNDKSLVTEAEDERASRRESAPVLIDEEWSQKKRGLLQMLRKNSRAG
ncbi:hypothetical protein BT69DRAFT_1329865 [Atractiella rhizophila]|nr:hypothetical protein BT69DRAFT_1329865 [Atractiella rhizophila]